MMKLLKSLTIVGAIFLFCGTISAQKMEQDLKQNYKIDEPYVRVALNAYSFSKDLNNYVLDRKGDQMTLFDLIDFCAVNKIDALDATGYFFVGYPEVPTDEYLYALKRYAHQRGVDFSGTGIRNNFADPDPAVRAAGVQHCKEWIDVAAKIGAPVIRVFAGAVPAGYENNWDVPAGWMVECLKECVAYGAQRGVIVGVQNHGDMLKTAEETIKIVKAVDSPWFGVILDTGYFMTEDPYVDMEAVMPYTVNWQVKESPFGKESTIRIDLPRVMEIIKKHNYRGYIPIETLSVPNRPYDPYTLVPAFAKEVKDAVQAAFGN